MALFLSLSHDHVALVLAFCAAVAFGTVAIVTVRHVVETIRFNRRIAHRVANSKMGV